MKKPNNRLDINQWAKQLVDAVTEEKPVPEKKKKVQPKKVAPKR